MDIISQLKEERAKIAGQLNALDTAITALGGLDGRGGSRGPRRMSASARAKISAAQKARWQKQKATRLFRSKPASDVFQQRD
jgi:hypothetical protein